MVRVILLLSFLLAALTAGGCAGGGNRPGEGSTPVSITVSAAASLREALEEIRAAYAGNNPGIRVTYNLGASGTLQRQIEEGAPADLFISADRSQVDSLSRKGLIMESSRKDLLTNELVLITGSEASLSGFGDLSGKAVGRVSIGSPDTVPAGKYARQTLSALGIWDSLQPRLVLARDVRQVLTYVETGNVDAGLVYRSDAIAGRGIKVVATAPDGSHDPIVYPLAVISSTGHPEESLKFASFLSGEEAGKIFEKYGFKKIHRQ